MPTHDAVFRAILLFGRVGRNDLHSFYGGFRYRVVVDHAWRRKSISLCKWRRKVWLVSRDGLRCGSADRAQAYCGSNRKQAANSDQAKYRKPNQSAHRAEPFDPSTLARGELAGYEARKWLNCQRSALFAFNQSKISFVRAAALLPI
jgi:hypothetical protein